MNHGTSRLSQKAAKFSSLTEIMVTALHTGEYRDPAFTVEINEIVEDIFADEIAQIRMVAAYERELLRRDMTILQLESLRALDKKFEALIKKMETEIKRVFQEVAQPASQDSPPDLHARFNVSAFEQDLKQLAPDTYRKSEDLCRERNIRINRHLSDIVRRFGL